MFVHGIAQQEQCLSQDIYSESMNILTQRLKGLPDLSNQQNIVDFNPVLIIVATPTMVLYLENVDEYGFLKRDTNIPKHLVKKYFAGRGYTSCRGLCIHIKKKNSRYVSYSKTQEYYCGTCEIAMKCVRCRCCSRVGRREPRTRNRLTRLLQNGTRYIE